MLKVLRASPALTQTLQIVLLLVVAVIMFLSALKHVDDNFHILLLSLSLLETCCNMHAI